MRDYQFISPSLDGIINHSSIVYEGIKRPLEVNALMDGPARRGQKEKIEYVFSVEESKIIEQYFVDIYTVFMKKLSAFVVDIEEKNDEPVTLLAMLQEMIKVKKLICRSKK